MAAQDDTAVPNGVTEAAAVPRGGDEAKVESISNAKVEQNKAKNVSSVCPIFVCRHDNAHQHV